MEGTKSLYAGFFVLVVVVLLLAFTGLGSWFRDITGRVTSPVTINITVGGPTIIQIFNNSMTDVSSGLTAGPLESTVLINFSVYNPSGGGNLNLSSARVNFTLSGEDVRQNLTCYNYQNSGNYANFSCNVSMWWWDAPGTWTISAYIEDNNTNAGQNITPNFYVGSATGFQLHPAAMTFPGVSPGGRNITSNNDPLVLNNTGNSIIGISSSNITINATSLHGETNDLLGLWAGNFSVATFTGGTPPVECNVSQMDSGLFVNITSATLPADNFTINDGSTGQEQLYVCLQYAGTELTAQSYSTANESAWTIQVY